MDRKWAKSGGGRKQHIFFYLKKRGKNKAPGASLPRSGGQDGTRTFASASPGEEPKGGKRRGGGNLRFRRGKKGASQACGESIEERRESTRHRPGRGKENRKAA